jgi:hypothetical protein
MRFGRYLQVVALGLLVACADDNENAEPSDDDDDGWCEVNESTDGTSVCADLTCAAGDYCASTNFGGDCSPGCNSSLDCVLGECCDLRNAETAANGSTVGTCRAPDAPEIDPPEDAPACPDVEGAYRISETTDVCNFDEAECNITQDGCDLTFDCQGTPMFSGDTLDADGQMEAAFDMLGFTGTCEAEFGASSDPSGFTWECLISGGFSCRGSGTRL